MPDFVYALHDFAPEHEDELSFGAGERIEVIEKDDLYGDGWWQGRSLSGKIGLFPQAYTTPSQPGFIEARSLSASVTPMQKLDEETEHEAAPQSATTGENGHVMAATLTDVQEAIEQLGAKPGQAEDQGSISFASSQGGETDKEINTDTENEDGDVAEGMDPEEWHRGARKLLAQNAAREIEKRRSAESPKRPPIPVELSDESEPEEGVEEYHHNTGRFVGGHKKQGSFDTMVAVSSTTGSTGRTPTVLEEEEPISEDALSTSNGVPKGSGPPSNHSAISLPTPTSPQTALPPDPSTLPDDGPRTATLLPPSHPQTPVPTMTQRAVSEDTASSLPSPTSSAGGPPPGTRTQSGFNVVPIPTTPYTPGGKSFGTVTIVNRAASPAPGAAPGGHSKTSSLSGIAAVAASATATSSSGVPDSMPRSNMPNKTHPSEWNVEQVVEWLRSKGFDEGVCAKFIEHEISGDILVELDATSLKELEIPAFGKRKKIENAIIDLRRPPSINSSSGSTKQTMVSLNSPHTQHASFASYNLTPRDSAIMSPESPPHTGDLVGTPVSERQINSAPQAMSPSKIYSDPTPWERQTDDMVGLGITSAASIETAAALDKKKSPKSKPAQLTLSSSTSDGALRKNGKAASSPQALRKSPAESGYRVDEDDDRLVMSENEAPTNTTNSRSSRRRMWGRSVDSTGSGGSRSHDASAGTAATSLPGSPFIHVNKRGSVDEKDKDKGPSELPKARPREQKSSSFAGGTERLSFFSGSLGKSKKEPRKAPPRYSAGSAHSDEMERERSTSGFGRLLSNSSSRKSQQGRPNTSSGIVETEKEKPQAALGAVLRKRSNGSGEMLKNEPSFGNLRGEPGRSGSIIEQIGKSDHSGWMRKKGERYNTWKLRYLVLKGPHLYYLASNSSHETKIKGYIHIQGYKVLADENVHPGRYGFRIIHDVEKPHFFSSEEQMAVREWMKALMKATIGRDYSKPVVSSCNIPTIPLTVAQAMNPAPRPPSPTARDATQKALRRENPHQLSSRDAQVLMGLPSSSSPGTEEFLPERADVNSIYSSLANGERTPLTPAPPRPARESRSSKMMRSTSTKTDDSSSGVGAGSGKSPSSLQSDPMINWANKHLPPQIQIEENEAGMIMTAFGLSLLRLGENIRGYPCEPPVPDSAFPTHRGEDRLDGLFRLFDLLLDEGVKMGMISINEVRSGTPEKIMQLLRAMKAWEEDRKAVRGQGNNSTPWGEGYGSY